MTLCITLSLSKWPVCNKILSCWYCSELLILYYSFYSFRPLPNLLPPQHHCQPEETWPLGSPPRCLDVGQGMEMQRNLCWSVNLKNLLRIPTLPSGFWRGVLNLKGRFLIKYMESTMHSKARDIYSSKVRILFPAPHRKYKFSSLFEVLKTVLKMLKSRPDPPS